MRGVEGRWERFLQRMRKATNWIPSLGKEESDNRLEIDSLYNEGYLFLMNMTAEKFVDEALTLPRRTRAFVAEKLIESLDHTPDMELSPSWRKEIRKRCQEMDQGLVELRSAEDVFEKAYVAL